MAAEPAPRLRILLGEAVALGPGKARLLTEIAASGSISAAARAMGMSYRRAWLLVAEMNAAFRAPLVEAGSGGRRGGGARLTAHGTMALARYRAMETKARKALKKDILIFAKLLNK
ncbi:MAG: winged helix-turn-helix domain-containing protein [Tagaea sp.]